jgi:hypothetical protein
LRFGFVSGEGFEARAPAAAAELSAHRFEKDANKLMMSLMKRKPVKIDAT